MAVASALPSWLSSRAFTSPIMALNSLGLGISNGNGTSERVMSIPTRSPVRVLRRFSATFSGVSAPTRFLSRASWAIATCPSSTLRCLSIAASRVPM
ncbi:hypothetical protein D3C72_2120120 [compost metagenome]